MCTALTVLSHTIPHQLCRCEVKDVLCHTIPHQLCRCEVKDVHGLQTSVSTQSEESDSFLLLLRSPAISLGFTIFG